MNVLKWVVVIDTAFSVGYFSRSPEPVAAPEVADCLRLDAFKDLQNASLQGGERLKQLEKTNPASNTQPANVEKQDKIAAPVRSSPERNERTNTPPAVGTAPAQPATVNETNLSDEEIDKLVAAPFNDVLKKVRGPLREKYKNFAEATEQDEWDRNTQNRITDALMGNAYSKFIELDSIACRASYCEIRGRELKPQVINLMVSEMMLQDWWEMGDVQWTSGAADKTFYALLMKRPAP
ncbi:MAG: hypothetical protein B0W54_14025 [Cellvibrio sp. 79]|nr:MAG: hypothetical protein B0W54_14025 [Cellvibrio sp. 79]